jgi:tetraacyldisaccharide 4'-kinase
MSAAAGALKEDSPMAYSGAAILENTIQSLRVNLTYLLLRLLGAALLPFLLLYALGRGIRQRAYFKGMKERLGWLPPHIGSTKPGGIWLHAVSVGEVLSALALLKHLRRRLPETPIWVSVTTLAGRELAESRLRDWCEGVFFAPVDLTWVVRRVLRRIQPVLLINFETEIWPVRLREAKRSGARWAQVNARISDRAWPRYRQLRWLFGAVLPQMDYLAAQSVLDEERFQQLGYPRPAELVGNLKFDFEPASQPVAPELEAFFAGQDAKPLWIAASTTGGSVDDDQAVLDAYEALDGRVRLVIAPRKPERFEVVAEMLAQRGIRFRRRSQLTGREKGQVLLLDSIGELAALLAKADVVFVGGSFNETQGHNLLEPAFFGKPVLTGPNMRNFAAIFAVFVARRAVKVVEHPAQLAAAVREALGDWEMGERGRQIAAGMRGVAAKIADALVRQAGEGVARGLLPLSTVLTPLSAPWVWVSQRPVKQRKLPVPVVSVGNLSMGGTGKTPVVLAIARALVGHGRRVGILTRGYGRLGRVERIFLPGAEAELAETGDEAQLFLREGRFCVGIAPDRYRAGRRLVDEAGAEVLVLDDGFQHRQLYRDLDLVCVDALRPFPGWACPPAGWLREPLAALNRADGFLLTRTQAGLDYTGLRSILGNKPVWLPQVLESLPGLPAAGRRLAFCGIGNPAAFRQSLDRLGLAGVTLVCFPDHHSYTAEDWARLAAQGEIWITTAKDAVKARKKVYVLEQKYVLPPELLALLQELGH